MSKRKVGILLGLFTVIWACQNNGTSDQDQQEITQDGKTLFKQNCITCHGLQGDMGAGGAANLRSSGLSLEERVVVITKGRNAMQPYEAVLSSAQIHEVAKYTLQLRDSIH